jgi:predicted nucleic acid-binding protein
LRFVVDAGPLVAAADEDDQACRLARAMMLDGEPDLFVTDHVVAEVDYVLRKRVSLSAARAFLEDVRTETYRRVDLDGTLFARAVDYDKQHADLDLGISDASVMALAEAMRIPILTFDFADFRATRPLGGGFWTLVVDEMAFKRFVRG